jgi:hypothetical protein
MTMLDARSEYTLKQAIADYLAGQLGIDVDVETAGVVDGGSQTAVSDTVVTTVEMEFPLDSLEDYLPPKDLRNLRTKA